MNAIANLLQSACRAMRLGSEIIGYAVSFGQSLVTYPCWTLGRRHPDGVFQRYTPHGDHI